MANKALIGCGLSFVLAAASNSYAFGAGQERPESWLRAGELGPEPKRTTDVLPLSDQGNNGNWEKYEPMSDEFEAAQLDPNKWWPRNPKWLGRQPGYFYPGNVRLSEGKLHLTMRKQEVPKMPKDKGYHTYTSAAVQSKTKVKYGYFEIMARPMKSHGSSSFWFYDRTPELWTEIDVFEMGGGAPGFERKYNMNVHVFRTPAEKRHWSMHGAWTAPSNLADDFHVYGLEWDEEKIKWYFDAVLVRWVENTHWHQALTLNFDSETMPKWFGLPRDNDLPSTYSIEYVRAWKKVDAAVGVEQTDLTAVPLFSDMTFERGFLLSYPDVSRGRRAEAVLDLGDKNSRPVWRLCQWGTKDSLAGAQCVHFDSGLVGYENETKRVAVGVANSESPDLLLEVRGAVEYGPNARKYGQSWPHLLVEQNAVSLYSLDELEEIRFKVCLRLLHCDNHMKEGEYNPLLHAAQFQMFFIVKNTNTESEDCGDYFWFGVPFFDSRHDIPPAYMAKDAGKDDATGKFIYTIAGSEISETPLEDHKWVTLEKDLLPYIKDGLKEAVERRYLISSDARDYAVANMNLGWEIPGTFDAAVQARNLNITAVVGTSGAHACCGATLEIYPATVNSQEDFERIANGLKPGDELILHGGVYSQTGCRAVTAKGTSKRPITIQAAKGARPVLTRPRDNMDRHNNIEFIDCAHLTIRGIDFKGGSSGVRFIRGHHITFEDCAISETGNNALTMNSGDCDSFIIRRNHIHHTGLSTSGSTEGEGMYIGCHSGSCITTNTLVEGNYIHHLRGTSVGGNDGIEIKFGSYGNIARDNVIHDTNIGRQYPGIFVYGGGPKVNIVQGNVIWNAGEGIQVVSDAIVRNNIIINCSATGITAAPHAAVPQMQNVKIVNNTILNHPVGVRIRWSGAGNMIFSNNAVYCGGRTAIDASGLGGSVLTCNYVEGRLIDALVDSSRFCDGGTASAAFVDPDKQNFWPKPESVLLNNADPSVAPDLDFNNTVRKPPLDVGAYETEGRVKNPGWQLRPGFKPGR